MAQFWSDLFWGAVLALCLFVALPVKASPFNLATCRDLASKANQIAAYRDLKAPIEDVKKALEDAIVKSRDDPATYLRDSTDEDMVRGLVDIIYKSKLPPDDIGKAVFAVCKKHSRETKST